MALAISLRPLRDTRQRRERGTLAISPWACNRHSRRVTWPGCFSGSLARGNGVRPSFARRSRLVKPCRAYSPGEQDLEERAVFAGERIEGPRRPAVWSGGGASDGVELADGWGRVVDAGESVEVAGVALRRNFLIAEEEGDPLAHGPPHVGPLSIAAHSPSNAKLLRLIDYRLHRQDAALVVHLDPVELRAMLDPAPWHALAGEIILAVVGDHFASVLADQLPPEETHHFFGAEVKRAVLEQPGHQVLGVFALAEEDIRRILGLRRHPIVFHWPQ